MSREHNRISAVRCRIRNRAFIAEVNAKTFCAHCGRQPIEWHNPEHVELNRQSFRIGKMVNRPTSIAAIQAELLRCVPLCSRCHMIEDGRLARFIEAGIKKGGRPRSVTPCIRCEKLYSPMRRGFCQSCYDKNRREARRLTIRTEDPIGRAV